MNEKFRLSHEHFVAIAKDMIKITDIILKHVVEKTEQAAVEISEKIQSVSNLSDGQGKMVRELITSMYQEGTEEHKEVEKIAETANDLADQIFEHASAGNLEQANALGNSTEYKEIGKKASGLTKQLEKISTQDKELANMIAPVIMALQFQDSVRQSLENIIKCFDEVQKTSEGMSQAKLPPEFSGMFWANIEKKFTSVDERNEVRKVIYGENAKLEESTLDSGGGFMF